MEDVNRKKSGLERLAGWVTKKFDAVIDHAIVPAVEKLIPQGASEAAQALFTGNGFTPYGPTADPVPMHEGGTVHGSNVTNLDDWRNKGQETTSHGPTDVQETSLGELTPGDTPAKQKPEAPAEPKAEQSMQDQLQAAAAAMGQGKGMSK